MDSNHMDSLKKMLEEGKIDQATYDEITERWEGEGISPEKEENNEREEKVRKRSGRVSISGSGNLTDVYSEELSISGSARVNGSVDVNILKISGSGHIYGNVKSSDIITVSGSAAISGDVEGNDIESSGSLTGNSLKCREMKISGVLKVKKDVIGEDIMISGGITAEKIDSKIQKISGYIKSDSINGEEIRITGKVEARKVTCKRFEMEIYGLISRIDKLDAEAIEIRYGRGRALDRLFSRKIVISEIRCKRAYLEGVISKSVIGDEIIVAEGSEIDYVEGKKIQVLEGATVKEKKGVP